MENPKIERSARIAVCLHHYMSGFACPWYSEFKDQWEKGKLAESIPELLFHDEDKTYSRLTYAETLDGKQEAPPILGL